MYIGGWEKVCPTHPHVPTYVRTYIVCAYVIVHVCRFIQLTLKTVQPGLLRSLRRFV